MRFYATRRLRSLPRRRIVKRIGLEPYNRLLWPIADLEFPGSFIQMMWRFL